MNTRRIIPPLWLATFIDSLGFGLAYPILTLIFTSNLHPLFRSEISEAGRYFLLGVGYLFFPAALFFGSSFLRDLSERFGRKPILLIGLFGIGLGFFLMGYGNAIMSLLLFLIGRALTGFFAGMQPIAHGIISEMAEGKQTTSSLKVLSSAIGIGLISGPILGGIFADSQVLGFFNDSTPFYFAALLSLVGLIWAGICVESAPAPFPDHHLSIFKPLQLLIEGFKDKQIFYLSLVFFLTQFAFITFYQTLQVKMSIQFVYKALDLGLFNGTLGLGFALFLALTVKFLAKRSIPSRLAWWGQLVTSVFIFITGTSLLPLIVTFFSSLSAGFYMVAFLMFTLCFSQAKGPMRSGYTMGIFASLVPMSWAISGLTTNLLSLFSIEHVLLFSGLLMLLASMLMKFYRRNYSKRA